MWITKKSELQNQKSSKSACLIQKNRKKQLIFMINLKLTKTQFIENHSNKKSD